MDIIEIITSFEFKTTALFLLFTSSSASIFFVIHSFLADIHHKHKIAFIATSIFLWSLAGYSGWHMASQLIAVPSVAKTTPEANGTIDALNPAITFTFNVPVDLGTMVVHTYPEIDLDIKPHGYLGNRISIGRSLTITAKVTLPPGENLMVYLSNIEGPYTRGYGGEYQLDIRAPSLDITTVSPIEGQAAIATDQTITVKLTQSSVTEKEWTVRSVPEHPFAVRQSDTETLIITPQTPLSQATQYTMHIIHTPVIRKRDSAEVIQTLPPAVKKTLQFTTVRPPILAVFEPQGGGVGPNAPIKISFDTPMDKQTVTERISITPKTAIAPLWDTEGKVLTLAHAAFPKNTGYTLSLKKGIKTQSGGATEADLTYQFHTAGALSIAKTEPKNGATDIPAIDPITLTFDQDVHPHVTDFVHVNPATTATVSAQGKTLTLFPAIPLAYETRYTLTVKAGAPGPHGLPSLKDQTFSFTTTPPSLAVPYFRQQSAFTCNMAAARMLLAYRKITVTEQDLIDAIGLGGKRGSGNPHLGYIDDYGTYWDPIVRGVSKWRPVRLIKGGNLGDIIAEIKKGNPVMTWGQNGWSDPHDISWKTKDGTTVQAINGMHSAVVRGYTGPETNPTQILLNDPWRGQYAIGRSEFMRRWGYFGVAMVVD